MQASLARAKPALTLLQIARICFGFLGIQIAFALQTGHFSRVFETLGADIRALPILWIAAPVTGLIVQPIIGHYSDRTWSRMGRRRPYFFWGAILTTAGLFVMPNASALWMAAGLLWIIDASLNVTMEPFRAFVADMTPQRQRTVGYAAQAVFIGIGGTLGSALPWLISNVFGVSDASVSGGLPMNIQLTFYIGGALLFASVMITVFGSKEYDPETLSSYEAHVSSNSHVENGQQKLDEVAPFTQIKVGVLSGVIGLIGSGLIFQMDWDQQLYILSIGLGVFGVLQLFTGLTRDPSGDGSVIHEIMTDIMRMPKTMRRLAVVQFFSWFAMFSMWIYLNNAVISFHYGGPAPRTALYEQAADWIGLLNGVYFAIAAFAALALPFLAARTSERVTHAIALVCGSVGFASFILIKDPTLLWVPMIGVGIVWASILSMPYAMLSSSLPSSKMGVYMGIFNFFIVIPQLVAASLLGLLVQALLDGQTIHALALGSVSFLIAAMACFFVPKPNTA